MSELTPTPEELNTDFTFTISNSTVVPMPIDPTLSNEGEAADARKWVERIPVPSVDEDDTSDIHLAFGRKVAHGVEAAPDVYRDDPAAA